MYKFLSIFFVILFSQNTQASSTISGKQISEILKSWLDDKGKPANFEILETIKYPYCERPNLIISDISASYNLIKISCITPNKWSFITRNKIKKDFSYSKKTKNQFKVITLKKTKSAGSTITEHDLIVVKKKLSRFDNLVVEKDEIVGRKLKNSISSGKPLYHNNFEKKWLIEKNSLIVIENKIGNITIKEDAVALDNADFMGKIRVKNVKSGKIIHGFAANEKKVVLRTKQN